MKRRVKADWKEGDIVKAGDNADIIAQFEELNRVLSEISLKIPDNLDKLSWRKANAIERILHEMIVNYDWLSNAWLICGEGYAGYDFEEHKLDDYWE
jgi:hypothetical protein